MPSILNKNMSSYFIVIKEFVSNTKVFFQMDNAKLEILNLCFMNLELIHVPNFPHNLI